ncbi:glycosyltransferase family 39 protein [Clostridium sp. HBUAS56010]|uniref:glycosyltransferase family 39 protein n=1 Tax=Clostridium sp. HBUAS56010 TaxID=2571127 RepID=UPI001178C05E|nr:glycosyltransferase family 39 protein [Clostridium sp. HBUAS56010]
MKDRQQIGEKAIWKDEVIAVILLLAFAFFINRGIEIKGLYMDDLYLWSCYGEQSFWEFVFPLGSTRFRFVYNLAAWLELMVVGRHIGWFVPINILINVCIAYTVYRFAKRLSGRWTMGFVGGILYLLSRMSYYQIGQVYGLMESLALWAAIGIFYCLYRYLTEEKQEKRLIPVSMILYFCICFIHERYMVLLPFFYAVFLMKKERKKSPWLLVTGVFALVQVIRYFAIGSISPAGTGGTNVADTVTITGIIRYAMSQVLYIFGINTGPEHLSGMSWGASPVWVRILIVVADLLLLIMTAVFLVVLVREKSQRKQRLKITGMFVLFIALCIGSSSVTIRVETRWIYVSMTAAWLFASYMCGVTVPKKETRANLTRPLLYCGLFLLYGILMFPIESFYRTQYDNLYYWPSQNRYNSLAKETYGKYGDNLFGKKIYIIGNSYKMSKFTADTFFKTFDKKRLAEGTEVTRIDSMNSIGLITPNMLVLREEPAHNSFQDVTDFVRNLKFERIYGCYEDGWLDQSAKARITAGKEGKLYVKFYYPGEITGLEHITVTVNGSEERVIPISASIVQAEFDVPPSVASEIRFESNFYYHEATEQRGRTHLSVVADISTN